eukprot:TRINITY_DN4579_c0_g1_i3.p1 TRINITY_DN4579_c0_g1~~TRINITY_DN4579_c0_g1_i3.p1  ORF type:complete len:140 (-),score=24.02 TRINITY_DN4579_c0_g1_i3:545-964(-)
MVYTGNRFSHSEQNEKTQTNSKESSSSSPPSPPTLPSPQRLDHFASDHGRTWKQRYWVKDTYFNPNLPGPLFVQFGEEEPASEGLVNNMAMTSYGQQYGALLVAIEHRFYGNSQPLPDLSDLSLLSVDQALADFAVLVG